MARRQLGKEEMTDSDLILVTGASGFVGKWCVVKLLQRGYRVRGTIRSEAKAKQVRETVASSWTCTSEARSGMVVMAGMETP